MPTSYGSGLDFDLEYLKGVIESHEKGADAAKKWSKDAKDAGVRDLAADMNRVLTNHLEHARKLYNPTAK